MSLPTEPYSRIERYLAKLAGQDVDIPDRPITRIECYLDYLVNNGGGGGGGGYTPAPNAGAHNSIFRGQSLGSEFTADQSAAITGGTFEDMFVGDYWTISGVTYRIMGFDLFMTLASDENRSHYAVIMPDGILYSASFNETASMEGGYYSSILRTTGLDRALDTFKSAFGETSIIHRSDSFSSAVSTGGPTAATRADTYIDIPTMAQIYGVTMGPSATNQYNTGDSFSRFPAFDMAPSRVKLTNSWYWLRDIVNGTSGYVIGTTGGLTTATADGLRGVRPYVAIA